MICSYFIIELLSFLFSLQILLEISALGRERVVPVDDKRWCPMWVEAPDGEGNTLLLKVFRDMVGIYVC